MNVEKRNPFAFFEKMGRIGSRIFLNKYFFLALFCAAAVITALDKEVEGAVAFVCVICAALVFCDDIMAIALPLTLLSAFVTTCYDSAETFMQYVWMAVPAVLSIVFHFVVYRGKFKIGTSFWGLAAVSVALTLGGVGFISAEEYFAGSALYHTFFLGFVMLGFYLLLKSQLSRKREYDLIEMMMKILYVTGIFVCLMVAVHALPQTEFEGGIRLALEFQPGNNLSTLLMFALPCPFFFARKNYLHLLSVCLMMAALVFGASRAGLLLGAVELVICIIVSAVWDKPKRFFYVCTLVCFAGAAFAMRAQIFELLEKAGMYPVVAADEARMGLIDRAFEYFKRWPVFGHGLGFKGNYDIYDPKQGALGWYHMMIPQVIGSMGIVGIAAYLFQAVLHVRIGIRAISSADADRKGAVITLLLSYVGVLMMSQVNPGLFCPLPYGLIAMAIFAALDGEKGLEPMLDMKRRLRKNK